MNAWVIGLLAVICVLLGWLVLSSERRRRALEREVDARFGQWRGQVEGKYQEVDQAKRDQLAGLQQERNAYRDLASRWDETVRSIEQKLDRISKDAMGTVEGMGALLKPIVSIFRSPQAAGIEFGEAQLELLLKTHLGEGLYARKPRGLAVGNETVDYAVTLQDCTIPIDCKFPSATYRAWVEAPTPEEGRAAWRGFRDAMLVQLEATAKYIKPDAGTTDYALLFVPSDVIYQHAFLAHKVDDQENPIPRRSQELQVFGCSPLTLMPYMGLIRLGLRNLRVAEDAKGIRQQIEELSVVFKGFSEDWKILAGHLQNVSSHVAKVEGGRGSLSRLREALARLATHQAPSGGRGAPAELETAPREAVRLFMEER